MTDTEGANSSVQSVACSGASLLFKGKYKVFTQNYETWGLDLQVMPAPALRQLRMSDQRTFKDQSLPFPFGCAEELQVLVLQGRCWRFNFQDVCTRLTKLVLSFHCDMTWCKPKSLENLAMLKCITNLRKIRFSGARSRSRHILDNFACLFPRSVSSK